MLTLKLLSSPSGSGLVKAPAATIHVMGRPLYSWTDDLKTIVEVWWQQKLQCPPDCGSDVWHLVYGVMLAGP